MEYHFENIGDVLKVSLAGHLTTDCSEEFKNMMFERMKEHKRILLNFQKVGHVDSAGLGALVSVQQRQQHDQAGTIKLCCLQPRPKIIFDITRVSRIFEIFDTETAALESFSHMT